MDIEIRRLQAGSNKEVGSWLAGVDSDLTITNEEIMKNVTAATIYRVFTVVVSIFKINIAQSA